MRYFASATCSAYVMAIFAMLAFGSACAAPNDAVQARKDLKAMGLEYRVQDFSQAAGRGDMTAVKLFVAAGMDVNEGGGAAIGQAAGRGKTDMVRFLLSNGAKPTANALQFARTRGHKEIEKLLVDAGAKE